MNTDQHPTEHSTGTDLLQQTFDAAYYLTQNLDVALAGVNPLDHYCTSGWQEGRKPNAWFDAQAWIDKNTALRKGKEDPFAHYLNTLGSDDPAIADHITAGGADLLQAHLRQAFDDDFYLQVNPDVAAAGAAPLDHYLSSGWREGRAPNSWFDPRRGAADPLDLTTAEVNPFLGFLATCPADQSSQQVYETQHDTPTKEAPLSLGGQLLHAFDATYYLTQNPDVILAEVDPLDHYLSSGWREGRRPNSWFKPDDWAAKHPELDVTQTNPFVHFLEYKDRAAGAYGADLKRASENKFIYWSGLNWQGEESARPVVVAAPLPNKADLALLAQHFDAEFYLEQNPDVAEVGANPLFHFATIGWIERRDPSPDFSMAYYLRYNRDLRQQRMNPFMHYLKHGHKEAWRKSANVVDAQVLMHFDDDEKMQARLAAAKALEPMVALPNEPRRVTSPLVAAERATDIARALRLDLAGRTYRYVVAVPHVRMSGASRVAAIFSEALANVRDPSDILVITTDSSEAEYIGWFPEGVDRIDLSAYVADITYENKIRILLDLLRGIDCATLVNVNSRLVWEALRMFGRQMSHEFKIVTYLFTWDETPAGNRVGYPIQWLRDTADHHHVLLTDTKNLANDVSDRLGFGRLDGEADVLPLYTPVPPTEAVANTNLPRHEPARVLWAGRFDAQKRLDVLVAIARANPHIVFDVYGKAVLDKRGLDAFDPPDNIVRKGTYSELQDVLDTPYVAFLYTAQWDGLPTILLDMAAAGLPIVAPDVGGIGELLDNDTGWLIDDFTDVDGYGAALRDLIANPTDARIRADQLKTRIAKQFAPVGYETALQNMVTKHDL
ncbi:glycosyltransferase family 4 protein [Aestuariibius sp. HNIBRBA575]|uniref:glycosyltransferase family 4 protein n=1 Tax=Aestuariibius sp. HNIBRBA575 TaxID=3233343 RepID=UPI0034A481E0